jgi:predicted Zn-dependent protease with MMP-like domain
MGNNDDDTTDHLGDDGTGAALEAAWRALEAGDVAGARRRAERIGADSPEGLFLLAGCAREEGDYPQALELLRRASEADPDWAMPELWIAELLADDDSSPDAIEQALRHAERALDLADEEPEFLSALALKAGLEIEAGDPDEARRTLDDLPPPEVALGDTDAALEIAELHLALGDADVARARLRTLTATVPDSADAWYALGTAAAELDDEDAMREAWKRAWQLDSAPGADAQLGRRLTDAEVVKVAEQALEEMPARARELLRDVPIVVAELPAEADVDDGFDPRALGLFSGTAYPDASAMGGQPGLTQIVIFRRNLERIADSDDQLREQIRTTLLHEAGHFFGMGDAELEDAGLG